MCEEKRVKPFFVEGFEGAVAKNARLYWSGNPSESLTEFARYSNAVTKITETRSSTSRFTIQPARDPSASRNRSKNDPQSFSALGEGEDTIQSVTDSTNNNKTNLTPRRDQVHTVEYAFEGTTR